MVKVCFKTAAVYEVSRYATLSLSQSKSNKKKEWTRTYPFLHFACPGCYLPYNGIMAFGVDVGDIEVVTLGFSQKANDCVRTVSMRLKFRDMEESRWY